MTFGALVQAETYGFLAGLARSVDLGNLTFPALLGVSPWILLAGLGAAALLLFLGLEAWERRQNRSLPSRPGTPSDPVLARA
jgi:hypothetical protein